MAHMTRYCKAFFRSDMRLFRGWVERDRSCDANIASEPEDVSVDICYLHDNYVVTNSIYVDEGIIYDSITTEWFDFCVSTLKFSALDAVREGHEVEAPEPNVAGD